MKKIIALLLLSTYSVVTFAQAYDTHDSVVKVVKQESKQEMVLPSLDVDFVVAVYLPLDVYASEGQAIDYTFQKTESGYSGINEKPPLQELQAIIEHRKKWIWQEVEADLKDNIPERQFE